MRIFSRFASVVLFVILAATSLTRDALAFGGTARELEHRGNFVVTNDADLAFGYTFARGAVPSFTLRPSLDYFIIDRLSIGGAVALTVNTPGSSFEIAPRVGYDVALSDDWSFWPQASLPIAFNLQHEGTAAFVTIALFAPFLLHPAEHFFFGAGPGLTAVFPTATVQLDVGFLIGGYFDR